MQAQPPHPSARGAGGCGPLQLPFSMAESQKCAKVKPWQGFSAAAAGDDEDSKDSELQTFL